MDCQLGAFFTYLLGLVSSGICFEGLCSLFAPTAWAWRLWRWRWRALWPVPHYGGLRLRNARGLYLPLWHAHRRGWDGRRLHGLHVLMAPEAFRGSWEARKAFHPPPSSLSSAKRQRMVRPERTSVRSFDWMGLEVLCNGAGCVSGNVCVRLWPPLPLEGGPFRASFSF